jgi:hypothetical protein
MLMAEVSPERGATAATGLGIRGHVTDEAVTRKLRAAMLATVMAATSTTRERPLIRPIR